MRKISGFMIALTVAGLVSGCEPDTQLAVQNQNNPDKDRALARPGDVETLISGSYGSTLRGLFGSTNDNVQNQMMVMALESYSGLANFAMGPRAAIPRSLVINSVGNSVASGNTKEFNQLSQAAKQASVGTGQLSATFTLGTVAQDLRARAFGNFVMGLSQGALALIYDSASIITASTPSSFTPPLVGYDSVMRGALALMDSAIFFANNASASLTGGFPLPTTWMAGNALTATQFVQLVRSYKAWLRAEVARTPADRAAVDWTSVLADAQAGITADFSITTNTTNNFDIVWPIQHYLYNTWHEMTPMIIGMADTSGGYQAWLSVGIASRGSGTGAPFTIYTPDNRFPRADPLTATGLSLTSQINYSGGGLGVAYPSAVTAPASAGPPYSPPVWAGKPYFRARPTGENAWAGSWGDSPYDYYRFKKWYDTPSAAGRTGLYPILPLAVVNGLIAEAAIRLGNWPVATAAIDATRVPANLPPTAGMASLATPVPGGTACVPKVPVGPAGSTTACGNIMEAMKWEKRMETAYTNYGAWFLDARGWGDLPAGTSLQWPVPYQELQIRFKNPYNNTAAAVVGTYGF